MEAPDSVATFEIPTRDRTAFSTFAGVTTGLALAAVVMSFQGALRPERPAATGRAEAPPATPAPTKSAPPPAPVHGAVPAEAPPAEAAPPPPAVGPVPVPPRDEPRNWSLVSAAGVGDAVQWVESGTVDVSLDGRTSLRVVGWEVSGAHRWSEGSADALGPRGAALPLRSVLDDEQLLERLAVWPVVLVVGLAAGPQGNEAESLATRRATTLAQTVHTLVPAVSVWSLDLGVFAGGTESNRPLRLLGAARVDGRVLSESDLSALCASPSLGPVVGSFGGGPFEGYSRVLAKKVY
jgi:hypothetical protein